MLEFPFKSKSILKISYSPDASGTSPQIDRIRISLDLSESWVEYWKREEYTGQKAAAACLSGGCSEHAVFHRSDYVGSYHFSRLDYCKLCSQAFSAWTVRQELIEQLCVLMLKGVSVLINDATFIIHIGYVMPGQASCNPCRVALLELCFLSDLLIRISIIFELWRYEDWKGGFDAFRLGYVWLAQGYHMHQLHRGSESVKA